MTPIAPNTDIATHAMIANMRARRGRAVQLPTMRLHLLHGHSYGLADAWPVAPPMRPFVEGEPFEVAP